mgnify:CR=1 FL=1
MPRVFGLLRIIESHVIVIDQSMVQFKVFHLSLSWLVEVLLFRSRSHFGCIWQQCLFFCLEARMKARHE